ncbi:MAG: GntR family transcriptional regulator [Ruminococcaceae bacterium]|nr:GntR family transcriptional regulator [Oscillospiraceae bacterium]
MAGPKSISLADMVYERLESDILGGKYQRGEVLSELKLSSELEVSRTPIREAVRRLEQEHLVREIGKGIEVIGIGIKDLYDIYEIRSRIEGLATRRCAEIITDEQLAELGEILDLQEFYTTKNSSDQIKKLDSSFHEKLYEYCGSMIYSATLTSLHRKVQKYRKMSVENHKRAAEAIKEHTEIYKALAEHDADRAEKLAVKHIENAKINILNSTK